jgi:dipeptidyl aminopeptidase/acylaminoacyl peptidase
MIARSRSVADPRWSPTGTRLAWVDSFDGRSDLLVAPASAEGLDGGRPPLLVTAETGLGGGYAWIDDDHLVVGAADGRLVVVHAEGGVVRTLSRDGRAFSPAVSSRGEVAFGVDRDDACDVVVAALDGSAAPCTVSQASYAWDPAWSPAADRLAWLEWDLPAMSWESSRIAVLDRATNEVTVVAEGACGQPRFSPDGEHLAYVRAGALCVDGEAVLAEEFEHAEPAWSPGQRSYAWSPDSSELAWCRNEDGFGRLVIGAIGKKSARELSKGWHRGIDWGVEGIVCARSGGVTPQQVVVLAPNGSARRTLARGAVGGFERTPLVEARAVTWKAGNATVHGLLWRGAGAAERPPMFVSLHGGPTGQALVDWNPRVQRFVQRGWTVLQPNYRGSTGYGDAYRRALDGKWGDRDVADVVAGIRHAVKEGWCDPSRIVVAGGSAGGLTALLTAAKAPDLVAAVVASYPVTDLVDLHATTHRFESGYTPTLVGALPGALDEFRDRSPVRQAASVRAPVLLLHGADDRSVRPEQSAAMADALRAAGVWVERHVYDGEGHGWRRAATIADELTRVDAFLARWVPTEGS